MLELQLLPARQGDAIWIRWRDGKAIRQLIVDMGTEGVGRALRRRFEALPVRERSFELLVVTHIDADHIGGVLGCLVDAPRLHGLRFHDVWFNGLDHLRPSRRPHGLEAWGGVQGQRLMTWLVDQRWNHAFGGQPIWRDGHTLQSCTLPGGLMLTVLGPTPRRLAELETVWHRELQHAMARRRAAETRSPGLEAWGRAQRTRPVIRNQAGLQRLASQVTGRDASKANGSSIVLLLEHEDRRILLAGDAYAEDVIEGLCCLSSEPFPLDAFKLPHHGSCENTTRAMIHAVDCRRFLFSTDGTQFQHPHAEAVACVIECGRRPRRTVELGFNERSPYNTWWDNARWKKQFHYRTRYGGDDGLTLRFLERRPRR
jgi:beta-lactamase superfamily II metal-dependent hydrolase